jgi:hypothetical protein
MADNKINQVLTPLSPQAVDRLRPRPSLSVPDDSREEL